MSFEGMIGEIRVFAGFVPRNWAVCDGSLLQITRNTALFSILGTQYGGDGKDTFGLPDLRGATAIGVGAGPTIPAVKPGEKVGKPVVALDSTEVPPHNHALARKGATMIGEKTESVGTNSNLAQVSHLYGAGQHELVPHLLQNTAPNTTLNVASISVSTGGQTHDNMQPYQVLNFGICLNGIFPTRS